MKTRSMRVVSLPITSSFEFQMTDAVGGSVLTTTVTFRQIFIDPEKGYPMITLEIVMEHPDTTINIGEGFDPNEKNPIGGLDYGWDEELDDEEN